MSKLTVNINSVSFFISESTTTIEEDEFEYSLSRFPEITLSAVNANNVIKFFGQKETSGHISPELAAKNIKHVDDIKLTSVSQSAASVIRARLKELLNISIKQNKAITYS